MGVVTVQVHLGGNELEWDRNEMEEWRLGHFRLWCAVTMEDSFDSWISFLVAIFSTPLSGSFLSADDFFDLPCTI